MADSDERLSDISRRGTGTQRGFLEEPHCFKDRRGAIAMTVSSAGGEAADWRLNRLFAVYWDEIFCLGDELN